MSSFPFIVRAADLRALLSMMIVLFWSMTVFNIMRATSSLDCSMGDMEGSVMLRNLGT